MNDETRKTLDEIFKPGSSKIQPLGASAFFPAGENYHAHYLGMFQVGAVALNAIRQLYDDAIAADDAAKLDAQREADINAANDAQRAADAKAAKDKQDKSGDE